MKYNVMYLTFITTALPGDPDRPAAAPGSIQCKEVMNLLIGKIAMAIGDEVCTPEPSINHGWATFFRLSGATICIHLQPGDAADEWVMGLSTIAPLCLAVFTRHPSCQEGLQASARVIAEILQAEPWIRQWEWMPEEERRHG